MKKTIELTIEHKDHYTVELVNGKGDTFTYNPHEHEGLEDFLSGAKILLIADVSNSVCENPHCKDGIVIEMYGETYRCGICEDKQNEC
jgi:hypothetical protein